MNAETYPRPRGAVPVEPVLFPRAEESEDTVYCLSYCAANRKLMRRWVSQQLDGLTFDAQTEARRVCLKDAEAELGRHPNANEYLLLATAVRDVLYARVSLARMGKR